MRRLLLIVAAVPFFIGCVSTGGGEWTGFGLVDDYRDRVISDQVLRHGAGGCAPNFVTGGCL